MAFRLRPRGSRPTQRDVAEPPHEGSATPAPEIYSGTYMEPDEGAASRIGSAADVDPNIARYGVVVGGPGGAGGYGGAGTK